MLPEVAHRRFTPKSFGFSILGIAVFCFLLWMAIRYQLSEYRDADKEAVAVERELFAIRPMDGDTAVSLRNSVRTTHVLAQRNFTSSRPTSEISSYYDHELKRMGWKYGHGQNLNPLYGESSSTYYCKGEYVADLFASPPHYAMTVSRGLNTCN